MLRQQGGGSSVLQNHTQQHVGNNKDITQDTHRRMGPACGDAARRDAGQRENGIYQRDKEKHRGRHQAHRKHNAVAGQGGKGLRGRRHSAHIPRQQRRALHVRTYERHGKQSAASRTHTHSRDIPVGNAQLHEICRQPKDTARRDRQQHDDAVRDFSQGEGHLPEHKLVLHAHNEGYIQQSRGNGTCKKQASVQTGVHRCGEDNEEGCDDADHKAHKKRGTARRAFAETGTRHVHVQLLHTRNVIRGHGFPEKRRPEKRSSFIQKAQDWAAALHKMGTVHAGHHRHVSDKRQRISAAHNNRREGRNETIPERTASYKQQAQKTDVCNGMRTAADNVCGAPLMGIYCTQQAYTAVGDMRVHGTRLRNNYTDISCITRHF